MTFVWTLTTNTNTDDLALALFGAILLAWWLASLVSRWRHE